MPVRGEDFFDREEHLNDLKRHLDNIAKGEKRNTALIGVRKVGKTSNSSSLREDLKLKGF